MLSMAVGIGTVSLLGTHASFADLMGPFALIGIGGGMTIPLTSVVVSGMPAERAGVASAVFNASREVAGLLGITVIGVVLTSRQHAAARVGASPLTAFLSGYRLGLVVAAALVAAGGVAAYFTLPRPEEVPAAPGVFAASGRDPVAELVEVRA
jgi:MFS family permease